MYVRTCMHVILGCEANSSNGPTVVLHLSTLDTNNIKRLSGLATREENTYLSITADLISDMTGLSVVPIDTGNASRVDKYTPDVTRPEFQGFDFDVDSGVLTLTFDETVDASTLQIDDITIQNLAESPTSEVSLRMSRVNSTDDPLVTVILEFEDLNRVKLDQNLATTDPDTYVALPLGAVMDLAFNANPSSPGVHTHRAERDLQQMQGYEEAGCNRRSTWDWQIHSYHSHLSQLGKKKSLFSVQVGDSCSTERRSNPECLLLGRHHPHHSPLHQ